MSLPSIFYQQKYFFISNVATFKVKTCFTYKIIIKYLLEVKLELVQNESKHFSQSSTSNFKHTFGQKDFVYKQCILLGEFGCNTFINVSVIIFFRSF